MRIPPHNCFREPTSQSALRRLVDSSSVLHVGNLGQILVGPDGKTLYIFLADTKTTSTCNGVYAQNWPPMITTGTPRAIAGVMQSLLGTSKRASGAVQVTYHGHPLYYFVGDTALGTANGEGIDAFGAEWDVINAAGMAITRG